jgi:hypothetical protein
VFSWRDPADCWSYRLFCRAPCQSRAFDRVGLIVRRPPVGFELKEIAIASVAIMSRIHCLDESRHSIERVIRVMTARAPSPKFGITPKG